MNERSATFSSKSYSAFNFNGVLAGYEKIAQGQKQSRHNDSVVKSRVKSLLKKSKKTLTNVA